MPGEGSRGAGAPCQGPGRPSPWVPTGACATTSAETIESSTFRTIREYGQRGKDAKEHGHGGKADTAIARRPHVHACLFGAAN